MSDHVDCPCWATGEYVWVVGCEEHPTEDPFWLPLVGPNRYKSVQGEWRAYPGDFKESPNSILRRYREYLESKEFVDDGPRGEPVPNWAVLARMALDAIVAGRKP
jgi:hypothetical protein